MRTRAEFTFAEPRLGADSTRRVRFAKELPVLPTETPTPEIPDFALLRRIGVGSYGEVWLARGITGMFRAVKVVRRDSFTSDRPYQREFQGVTKFVRLAAGEPSQLAVLHAGQARDESYFFYVMELADDVRLGRTIDPATYEPLTLANLRDIQGAPSVARCLEIGLALALGVATLHRHGLVHRDIKPSNIVLVGGVPKLADIGLVAEAEAGRTFVGSEIYTAPEGPGQPAADVFALARVLYELWTGHSPLDWPKGLAEAAKRSRDEAEWAAVLERAGAFVSARRHASAEALVEELALLRAGRSVLRLRLAEKAATRLRRGLLAAGIIGGIAAVAATAAIRFERNRAEVANQARRLAEAERDALARRAVYASALTQTQRALGHHDFGAARNHLRDAVPVGGEEALRGLEWHLLERRARGNAAWRLDLQNPVRNLASFPGQTTAVAQTLDGSIHFVDTKAGRVASRQQGDGNLIGVGEGLVWLHRDDGRWLGIDATGATVRAATLPGEGRPLLVGGRPALFSSAGAARGQLQLQREPGLTTELPFPTWEREWYVVSPQPVVSGAGDRLAVVLRSGTWAESRWRILVWSLPDGRTLLDQTTADWISAIALSPDGRALHLFAPDRHWWRTQDLEDPQRPAVERPLPEGFAGDVVADAFGRVHYATANGAWQVSEPDGTLRTTYAGPAKEGALFSVEVTSGRLVAGNAAGELFFWPSEPRPPTQARLDVPSGGGLVTGLMAQTSVWLLQAGPNCSLYRTDTWARTAEWSASGYVLGYFPAQHRVVEWDTKGQLLSYAVGARAEALRWNHPGGSLHRLLTAETLDSLLVVDRGGRGQWLPVATLAAAGPDLDLDGADCLGLDEARQWLYTADGRGRMSQWRISNGKRTVHQAAGTEVGRGYAYLQASADGRWLAAMQDSAEGRIDIFDTKDLRIVTSLVLDGNATRVFGFTHDNRRLVCPGANGTLRLFEVGTWTELPALDLTVVFDGYSRDEVFASLDLGQGAGQMLCITQQGRLFRSWE